jgi:metal-dependent amidase/aminoacylase/carboxypeptidase family protein
MEFRRELRKEGKIRYLSGKLEFMYRGYLDDVDIAMMIHQGGTGFGCTNGTNGSITKFATFRGRSAHAGGSPHKGINALYAATTALSAANALRETFLEKDTIRFHPIITKGGTVVNAIPDEVITEAYIRGGDYEAIRQASKKINRAFAGAAAALGCEIYFEDEFNNAPRINDANLRELFHRVARLFYSEDRMNFNQKRGTGCSDMGNICCVMPTIHPNIGGCTGNGHSDNYYVVDPYNLCVTGAKIQLGVVSLLLSEGGRAAKKVLAEAKVPFRSKEEFFRAREEMSYKGDGVIYNEDGTVTLNF